MAIARSMSNIGAIGATNDDTGQRGTEIRTSNAQEDASSSRAVDCAEKAVRNAASDALNRWHSVGHKRLSLRVEVTRGDNNHQVETGPGGQNTGELGCRNAWISLRISAGLASDRDDKRVIDKPESTALNSEANRSAYTIKPRGRTIDSCA